MKPGASVYELADNAAMAADASYIPLNQRARRVAKRGAQKPGLPNYSRCANN
jgi:hypothetical protein